MVRDPLHLPPPIVLLVHILHTSYHTYHTLYTSYHFIPFIPDILSFGGFVMWFLVSLCLFCIVVVLGEVYTHSLFWCICIWFLVPLCLFFYSVVRFLVQSQGKCIYTHLFFFSALIFGFLYLYDENGKLSVFFSFFLGINTFFYLLFMHIKMFSIICIHIHIRIELNAYLTITHSLDEQIIYTQRSTMLTLT